MMGGRWFTETEHTHTPSLLYNTRVFEKRGGEEGEKRLIIIGGKLQTTACCQTKKKTHMTCENKEFLTARVCVLVW